MMLMSSLSTYTVAVTHWGRDKMGDTFQTTFLNALSAMQMFEFRLKFVHMGLIDNKWALV